MRKTFGASTLAALGFTAAATFAVGPASAQDSFSSTARDNFAATQIVPGETATNQPDAYTDHVTYYTNEKSGTAVIRDCSYVPGDTRPVPGAYHSWGHAAEAALIEGYNDPELGEIIIASKGTGPVAADATTRRVNIEAFTKTSAAILGAKQCTVDLKAGMISDCSPIKPFVSNPQAAIDKDNETVKACARVIDIAGKTLSAADDFKDYVITNAFFSRQAADNTLAQRRMVVNLLKKEQ